MHLDDIGPPRVHAREHAGAAALCGAEPGSGTWTRARSKVTCILCIDEIGRRLRGIPKDLRREKPPRH